MPSPKIRRPGPMPGPPRPISFRINLTEAEHKKARLIAAHEGRSLADVLREDIERRYQVLGLDAASRPRAAREAR